MRAKSLRNGAARATRGIGGNASRVRYARIRCLAVRVLEGKAAAAKWLGRPQIGLGGRIPATLPRTARGRAEVERLLLRIEHSTYT